jgi:Raf kinase inhibitor-like YbhB/YbcL family protein
VRDAAISVRTATAPGRAGRNHANGARPGLHGANVTAIGLVVLWFVLAGCGRGEGADLRVSSPDLQEGRPLPERFTCTGDNEVPNLTWTGAPSGTLGWAVVVEDPDAPGGTFTHWIVTGLGAAARSLGGELPAGAVEGTTSSGQPAYVGPCPPTGEEHRFRYRVHALRELLVLEPAVSVTESRRRIEALSLDAAEIEVTYQTP